MAIALLTHVSRATAGTSAAIDTSGATVVVAAVSWTNATIAYPALSDSKSNVWTPIGISGSQPTGFSELYLAINPTVGSGHTFTITGATTSACVASFSGTTTSFPSSISKSASTSSATSLQPGSLTPEVDNCLMLSVLTNRVATVYAVDSSFTITDQVQFAAGTIMGCALAYLVETATAAQNPTWSWTGAGLASSVQCYIQPPYVAGNVLPVA